MHTLIIVCRGGRVPASDRDQYQQLDGTRVAAVNLDTGHTIPGAGRVLKVIRLEPERPMATGAA